MYTLYVTGNIKNRQVNEMFQFWQERERDWAVEWLKEHQPQLNLKVEDKDYDTIGTIREFFS